MAITGTDTIGLVAVLVAVLCFGSNFVVTKKYKTGDGMMFQLCLCIGIWFTGMIVNIIRGFPTFQPIAMLGGCIWACGNIWVVPIVRSIGLAQGILLWGASNTIAGWASGKWGHQVLGLETTPVANPGLNVVGVLISLVSLVMYAFVKAEGGPAQQQGDADGNGDEDTLLPSVTSSPQRQGEEDKMWVDKLPEGPKKAFGVTAAIVSGIFYGLNFDPPAWVKAHVPNASQHLVDYTFSHFTGILLTSIVFFVIYAIWTKNNPAIFPKAIAPAMLSGVVWAIAQTSWFVANNDLSFVVAFPLVAMGPGVVASLWGVFVFGEIKGRRNFIVLISAFVVAAISATVLVISKVG